jgi:hypothetical protein
MYNRILTTSCYYGKVNFGILTTVYFFQSVLFPGNTKGGSTTVPLTSCLVWISLFGK